MNETSDDGTIGDPEQLSSATSTFDELRAEPEVIEAVVEPRDAQIGWLERRGIDPASIPHLTMGGRELRLLRNAPPDYLDYARRLYEIPHDDQDGCEYALVDIQPDNPTLPHEHKLMVVNEADFGTMIGLSVIAKDFQKPDTDPNNPPLPESPNGALKTVDIANTLVKSGQELQMLAAELMKGRTTDPLSSHYGDIGVRAGGLAPGQEDAYVWTASPFAKSVELTIAFPWQYDSVCVVRGQRREAANGKPGMAQIDDPATVLKIEGKDLGELQRLYRELYREPDFALTEEQRRGRDELFNDYLAHQISQEASRNSALEQQQEDNRHPRRQQPQLRARELPRP